MSDKTTLRAQALAARRAGGDPVALIANLRAALAPHGGKVLAGYWPIRGEADPRPVLADWDGAVVLPVVVARDTPLTFRRWQSGDALDEGAFGTAHPPEAAPALDPQVLIVPLAGFDRAGNRLGYGGGYYDRTLARLRAAGPVVALGLAYGVQELAAIPVEPTDQPLDAVVTDHGVFPRP